MGCASGAVNELVPPSPNVASSAPDASRRAARVTAGCVFEPGPTTSNFPSGWYASAPAPRGKRSAGSVVAPASWPLAVTCARYVPPMAIEPSGAGAADVAVSSPACGRYAMPFVPKLESSSPSASTRVTRKSLRSEPATRILPPGWRNALTTVFVAPKDRSGTTTEPFVPKLGSGVPSLR
jgi:hypothetical protein